MAEGFEVFAPGRLGLFGDRPVDLLSSRILQAIDRGVRVRVTPRSGSKTFDLELPEPAISDVVPIDGSESTESRSGLPFLIRSAVRRLLGENAHWSHGAHFQFESDVPFGAYGSIAATAVAFMRALVELAGARATRLAEPRRIGDLARRPLSGAFFTYDSPFSTALDAFASALGGLHYVGVLREPDDPDSEVGPFVQELSTGLDGFVLIETGSTAEATQAVREAVARRRVASTAAIERLLDGDPKFEFDSISYEWAWDQLVDRTAAEQRDVFGVMFVRDVLHAALRFLNEKPLDVARIGELLDEHHARLRDDFEFSTPRIEDLRKAAAAAGALGSRVEGDAGERLFALAPGRTAEVVAAVEQLGAKASVVRPSAGVTLRPLT